MSPESKPRRLTDEHRANISRGVRQALSTPQMSEKLSQAQQAIWAQNPERRIRQSEIQLQYWQDPNHKAKMTESRTGIPVSKKTRKKISKALTGKPSPLKGRVLPEEHKRKIAQARKEQYVDLDLFKIGRESGILPTIFSEEEIKVLEDYFQDKKIKKDPNEGISGLLDKLSIAIANSS
jgi:hypothetical protein